VTIRQSQEAGRIDLDLPLADGKCNDSAQILSSLDFRILWEHRHGILYRRGGIACKIVSYGCKGEKQAGTEIGCSTIPELGNV